LDLGLVLVGAEDFAEKDLDDEDQDTIEQDRETMSNVIEQNVDGVRKMMVAFSQNTQIANMRGVEWSKKSRKEQHEILDMRQLLVYFLESADVSNDDFKLFETKTWRTRWGARFDD
jgi:hypothetical protein